MNAAHHLPVLAIVLPLVFAYLMPLFDRWRRGWCTPAALGVLAVSFAASLGMAWQVMTVGPYYYHMGNWPPPWGIELHIDYLAVFTAITMTGVSLVVLVYASKDLLHELKPHLLGWYYTLYLLLVASMVGMALTNDIFNLFVFVEICAIAACGIISVKSSKECLEASFKYLILSALGSGCLLLAIALLYMVTGHLNFTYIAQALPEAMKLYPYNILAALALLLVGMGVKAALFPLHVWLPDAHSSAPSPSSAVLSGLVIKIYAVSLLRVLYQVFPADIFEVTPVLNILLWMSTLAIIVGSMFAIVQEDIKKMLAYSSVAQIGYVFMGFAIVDFYALTGGILHVFNHAMMKAMLFLAAGAFIYSTGVRHLSGLKGIGHTMPVTAGAFAIGALAMVGIPLTNGFISKWYLVHGALHDGQPFFAAVILLSSLLNGIYYLPIIVNAFFSEPQGRVAAPLPLPRQMQVPLIILGLGCLLFGIAPSLILGLIYRASEALLGL